MTDPAVQLGKAISDLPQLPPVERASRARELIAEARSVLSAYGDAAVVEALAAGRTYGALGAELGISAAAINKAVTRHRHSATTPLPRRDTYNPADWEPLPDGRWKSPKGFVYAADTEVVQRVMAQRVALGLDEASAISEGEQRAEPTRQTARPKSAAKSTAYALAAAEPMLAALQRAGLVDKQGRDAKSKRKVLSIVREIARVARTAEEAQHLYAQLREQPIAEAQRVVRDLRDEKRNGLLATKS